MMLTPSRFAVSVLCSAFLVACTSDEGAINETGTEDESGGADEVGTMEDTTNPDSGMEGEGNDETDSGKSEMGEEDATTGEEDPSAGPTGGEEDSNETDEPPTTGEDPDAGDTETTGDSDGGTGDETGDETDGETGSEESGEPEPVDECVERGIEISQVREVEPDAEYLELNDWEIQEDNGEDWEVFPSAEAGEDASVTFKFKVLCEGEWRIWVRRFNAMGTDESFYVRIDEGDWVRFNSNCDDFRRGYRWKLIDARELEQEGCDESASQFPENFLTEGEHTISFREASGVNAIASIMLTNDLETDFSN